MKNTYVFAIYLGPNHDELVEIKVQADDEYAATSTVKRILGEHVDIQVTGLYLNDRYENTQKTSAHRPKPIVEEFQSIWNRDSDETPCKVFGADLGVDEKAFWEECYQYQDYDNIRCPKHWHHS